MSGPVGDHITDVSASGNGRLLSSRRLLGSGRPFQGGAAGDDLSSGRGRLGASAGVPEPFDLRRSSIPPTLLITGNRDELIHWGESLRMYQALVAAGVSAEIHIFDRAPHAFDLLPEFGRQCAGILSLFLDTHVLNPRSLVIPSQHADPP